MDAMHPKAAELLEAVEREFRKLSGPFTPIAGALIGTAAVAGILYTYEISCWWSLAWFGPAFVVALLMERSANVARRRYPSRVEQSALLDKLLLGPTELDDIYKWTPWPWSILFLGFKPYSLQRWVRLVANNVEWYLDEPRRYLKAQWVAKLLALIGPFIINAPMYYTHGTTYQSFQQYFALICSFGLGVSIFQMFVAVENAKQLTAMRALRNCIQLRFVEVQTEP